MSELIKNRRKFWGYFMEVLKENIFNLIPIIILITVKILYRTINIEFLSNSNFMFIVVVLWGNIVLKVITLETKILKKSNNQEVLENVVINLSGLIFAAIFLALELSFEEGNYFLEIIDFSIINIIFMLFTVYRLYRLKKKYYNEIIKCEEYRNKLKEEIKGIENEVLKIEEEIRSKEEEEDKEIAEKDKEYDKNWKEIEELIDKGTQELKKEIPNTREVEIKINRAEELQKENKKIKIEQTNKKNIYTINIAKLEAKKEIKEKEIKEKEYIIEKINLYLEEAEKNKI